MAQGAMVPAGHRACFRRRVRCGRLRAELRLGGARAATYRASVREGAEASGQPLGVIAIHFDWKPQARVIVQGGRVPPEDCARTRVLLVDAGQSVIVASDGVDLLSERLRFDLDEPINGVRPMPVGRGQGRPVRDEPSAQQRLGRVVASLTQLAI